MIFIIIHHPIVRCPPALHTKLSGLMSSLVVPQLSRYNREILFFITVLISIPCLLGGKAYEDHVAKNGQPDSHAKAKEILS